MTFDIARRLISSALCRFVAAEIVLIGLLASVVYFAFVGYADDPDSDVPFPLAVAVVTLLLSIPGSVFIGAIWFGVRNYIRGFSFLFILKFATDGPYCSRLINNRDGKIVTVAQPGGHGLETTTFDYIQIFC